MFAEPATPILQTLKTTYIEFPPVTYTNELAEADGYLIDTMYQVLSTAGYQWTIRPYPVNRMMLNMVNGDTHVWIGAPSLSGLRGHVLVGEKAVTEIHFRAYYYGDFGPIEKKEDLLGRRVIIMRGYDYNGWTDYIKRSGGRIKYFESDSHEQALRALRNARGDILLDYQRPISQSYSVADITRLKSSGVFSQPLHFLVSKKAPKAEEVLERINTAHAQLIEQKRLPHSSGAK